MSVVERYLIQCPLFGVSVKERFHCSSCITLNFRFLYLLNLCIEFMYLLFLNLCILLFLNLFIILNSCI